MTLLGIVLAIVVVAIFWRIFAGLFLIITVLCILSGAYIGFSERQHDNTIHTHPARR